MAPRSSFSLESLEDRVVPATFQNSRNLGDFEAARSWGNQAVVVPAPTTPTLAVTVVVPAGGDGTRESTDVDRTAPVTPEPVRTTDPTPYNAFNARLQGDFNGDGLADTAGFTPNGLWKVSLSEVDHFSTSTWNKAWASWRNWIGFYAADLNADGRTDIVGLHKSGTWIAGVSTGSSFLPRTFATGWSPGFTAYVNISVGDFDGDGKTDVAGLDNQGNWWVGRSNGRSFETTIWSTNWADASVWKTFQVGDFNGDGKDDIAAFHVAGQWWLAVSTGTSFYGSVWRTDLPAADLWTAFRTGDYNGDGQDDIAMFDDAGRWYLSRSNLVNFEYVAWADGWGAGYAWSQIQAADFDLDGRDDVLAQQNLTGDWWVLYSTGENGVARRIASAPVSKDTPLISMRALDYNGDSRPDIAVQTYQGDAYIGLNSGETAQAYFGVQAQKTFFVVAPFDIEAIRKDPSAIARIFPLYKEQIRNLLGPTFAKLNDEGLAYVFAGIVSYQSASYRGAPDPDGSFPTPTPFSIRSLLDSQKLVCNEYVFLTNLLFREIVPSGSVSGEMTGWVNGTFFSHTQIFVKNAGMSVLIDPTLGIIAAVDLSDLDAGRWVASSRIVDLTVREETSPFMQGVMDRFRTKIHAALERGLYPQATKIYVENIDSYLRRIPRSLWPAE